MDTLADLQAVQLHRGAADDLEDDVHSALFAVVVMDGDGDALTVLVDTQNDELAGLSLFRHHRRLNLVEDHSGLERFFFHDAIHE